MPKLIKETVILNLHANSSEAKGTWQLCSSFPTHIPTSWAWLMHNPPLQGRVWHKYTYIPLYSCQSLPRSCPCCPFSVTEEVCMYHTNIPNSVPTSSPSRACPCYSVPPQQTSLKDLMAKSNSNTRCSSGCVTSLAFRAGEVWGL